MTDDRNLSTEHQREGDARRPSDTLDKEQVRRAKPATRGSGTLTESEASVRERSRTAED